MTENIHTAEHGSEPPSEVLEMKQYLETRSGDHTAFSYIQSIRDEFEPLDENSLAMIEAAREEIALLPDNCLLQLLERFAPYIDSLPAGHSKGHLSRDIVHASQILHDPQMESCDDLNTVVMLYGGIFHDIANAVMDKYDDDKRLASHAEAGAFLFGIYAADLVPQHLRKLIQLSIAAHTHLLKPKHVEGYDIERQPYTGELYRTILQKGIYGVRQADRADNLGPVHFIRHIAAISMPVSMSLGDVTYQAHSDEDEEFIRQFDTTPDTAGTTATHLKRYADSALQSSPYSEFDSAYLSKTLYHPEAEMSHLILDILANTPQELSTPEEKTDAFIHFLRTMALVEPGMDIAQRLDRFAQKFTLLPDRDQQKWLVALNNLSQVIYPYYWVFTNQQIATEPTLMHTVSENVRPIVQQVYTLAKDIHQCFHPSYIDAPDRMLWR